MQASAVQQGLNVCFIACIMKAYAMSIVYIYAFCGALFRMDFKDLRSYFKNIPLKIRTQEFFIPIHIEADKQRVAHAQFDLPAVRKRVLKFSVVLGVPVPEN